MKSGARKQRKPAAKFPDRPMAESQAAVRIDVVGAPMLSVHNAPVIKGVCGRDMVTFQHEAYSFGEWGIDFSQVPPGEYMVETGHFEGYTQTSGYRVFHIAVNGQAAAMNVDIFSEAGYRAALWKRFPASPAAGKIAVRFKSGMKGYIFGRPMKGELSLRGSSRRLSCTLNWRSSPAASRSNGSRRNAC